MAYTPGDKTQSRRGFINWLVGTSLGGLLLAVLYPVTRYLIPPTAAESAAASVTLSIKPEDPASCSTAKTSAVSGVPVTTVTSTSVAVTSRARLRRRWRASWSTCGAKKS